MISTYRTVVNRITVANPMELLSVKDKLFIAEKMMLLKQKRVKTKEREQCETGSHHARKIYEDSAPMENNKT